MTAASRALLAGLVDYAGLFPPAALPMARAVAEYAAHRRGPERWMLGRFVVPVARLGELADALAGLDAEERGGPWELSAVLGADAGAGVREVAVVNARLEGAAVVRAVEARVETVAAVAAVRTAVPRSFELFCEVPLRADLRWLLASIRAEGARAKARTGGVTPADVPAPDDVLAFLEGCAAIRLPFKATAGLHHAVRAERALTYEATSPRAVMHGHLNVVLAAAALWLGRPRVEARRLLEAQDGGAVAFEADTLRWGGSTFGAGELAGARRDFVRAFGSCSFAEPVAELRALGADLTGDGAAAAASGRREAR